MDKKNNLKSFSALTAFSLSEKVIAFVYQAIIAAILGAGIVTDCFYSASQLFDLVDSTVLGALVVVVINRYVNISSEKGEAAGFSFLSKLNSILSIIMIALAIMVFVFAEPLSYVIAPGFNAAARPGLITCLRFLCVIPPIMVFATIAQGLLRVKKSFIIANSRSLLLSLCGMMAVLLFARKDPENVAILCLGYIAANILFSVLLYVRSRSFGRIGFSKPVFDQDIKKMIAMAVPAIISKGIVRISMMIDQVISSLQGAGSVSYLIYAHSLYYVVESLLIVNLCTVMLTDFTTLCVDKQYEKMIKKLRLSISSIMLILAPVSLLAIGFSQEIVAIVYQRGAFGQESTQSVGVLLFFYAIGFVPVMLNSMHTQVLHAFGSMKIAMRNSVVSFGINIAMSLILSRIVGIAGIAMGTTISAILVVPLFTHSVRRHLPNYKHVVEWKFLGKLIAGLLSCAIVIIVVKHFISTPLWSFVAATIGGIAAFAIILLLLKEKIAISYYNKLLRKVRRKT